MLIYEFQYKHNPIYRQFTEITRTNDFKPQTIDDIPFLPITLFKSNIIKTGIWEDEAVFESSGTTGQKRSRHFIFSLESYLQNARHIWELQFGSIAQYEFVSLLPSYQSNPSSSLIKMVSDFMMHGSAQREQYFYNRPAELYEHIEKTQKLNKPCVLFGVSFALLDYLEQFYHRHCPQLTIVETGGMKKFRREITRAQLHRALKDGFRGARIVSEYGMTECLSQMYASDGSHFKDNDRMKILISDPSDPIHVYRDSIRGRINIIDLANIDTICFITTDDLGLQNDEGTQILGRLENSDLRGCNYLI